MRLYNFSTKSTRWRKAFLLYSKGPTHLHQNTFGIFSRLSPPIENKQTIFTTFIHLIYELRASNARLYFFFSHFVFYDVQTCVVLVINYMYFDNLDVSSRPNFMSNWHTSDDVEESVAPSFRLISSDKRKKFRTNGNHLAECQFQYDEWESARHQYDLK